MPANSHDIALLVDQKTDNPIKQIYWTLIKWIIGMQYVYRVA